MASTINASTSAGGGIIQTADASGDLALQGAGTTVATATSTGFQVNTYLPATSLITTGTAKAWNWNGLTTNKSIDFTDIPSWVKRITVMFNAVSTNGTSVLQVQLGTSSGVTDSGYIGTSDTQSNTSGAPTALTSGLGLGRLSAATYSRYGQVVFTLIDSNTWSGIYVGSTAVVLTIEQGSCAVTLANALDRVRITTVNDIDTFDAGTINIMYE